MAIFVHVAPEKKIKSIERSGIKPSEIVQGVYCMPMTENYVATYQWNRELKRSEQNKQMKAVHFRIPDEEMVYIGHYTDREEKQFVKASEAVKLFRKMENKMGYEIIVPRKITKKEIIKIKNVNQNAGWRYYPKAHETKLCICSGCISGRGFKDTKLKQGVYMTNLKKMQSQHANTVLEGLRDIQDHICTTKVSYSKKEHFITLLSHENEKIVIESLDIITRFYRNDENDDLLKPFFFDKRIKVREKAIEMYMDFETKKYKEVFELFEGNKEMAEWLKEYYEEWKEVFEEENE